MKNQTKLMTAALLFVLCFTFVTTALATDGATEDITVESIFCWNDYEYDEWCDSQNNWNKRMYFIVVCLDGTIKERTLHYWDVFPGQCPY